MAPDGTNATSHCGCSTDCTSHPHVRWSSKSHSNGCKLKYSHNAAQLNVQLARFEEAAAQFERALVLIRQRDGPHHQAAAPHGMQVLDRSSMQHGHVQVGGWTDM